LRFYLFGANRSRLKQVAEEKRRKVRIVTDFKQADLFLTVKSYYTRKPQKIRDAEALGIPIYVLKSNNANYMRQCLDTLYPADSPSPYIQHVQHLLTKSRELDSETQRTK
jgi:hypothetical protein